MEIEITDPTSSCEINKYLNNRQNSDIIIPKEKQSHMEHDFTLINEKKTKNLQQQLRQQQQQLKHHQKQQLRQQQQQSVEHAHSVVTLPTEQFKIEAMKTSVFHIIGLIFALCHFAAVGYIFYHQKIDTSKNNSKLLLTVVSWAGLLYILMNHLRHRFENTLLPTFGFVCTILTMMFIIVVNINIVLDLFQ